MSRYRVSAGVFGPGPGQAAGKVQRVNLGRFGPGEDQRKARALYAADEAETAGQTPNGHGRNIATAGDVASQRFADFASGRPSRLASGPAPDMAWDALFGALQRKEEGANAAGYNFNAKPALRNLGRPNRGDSIGEHQDNFRDPFGGLQSAFQSRYR